MTFRLNSIKIRDNDFITNEIELVNTNRDKSENYFSLIVGNNGTGKSRLLGSIARALKNPSNYKQSDLFSFSEINISREPSKLIALSYGLNDKFPMDNTFRPQNYDFNYKSEKYNYLGMRGRMNTSSRLLMQKAIDIFLENYSDDLISRNFRQVFDYLDYKPIIELEYRLFQKEFSELGKNKIEPKHIFEYLNKQESYSGFKTNIFNSFKERFGYRINEICTFLNLMLKKELKVYNLIIDFSSGKIKEIDRDIDIYEENVRLYEILNILRKINLVKGFDVKVYKKNDSIFYFKDASSGEANILTTLLSLIPLIENNCCVLIDEPEISLHPSWQYRYIELLNNIFKSFKGCHILIASHSHFLVSDLPIDCSSVISLQNENGKIKSYLLPESTFGWSAEDILLNIFQMPTSRNFYVSNLVSEALELIAEKKKKSKRFKELKIELNTIVAKLKDVDPLKEVINTIFEIE